MATAPRRRTALRLVASSPSSSSPSPSPSPSPSSSKPIPAARPARVKDPVRALAAIVPPDVRQAITTILRTIVRGKRAV